MTATANERAWKKTAGEIAALRERLVAIDAQSDELRREPSRETRARKGHELADRRTQTERELEILEARLGDIRAIVWRENVDEQRSTVERLRAPVAEARERYDVMARELAALNDVWNAAATALADAEAELVLREQRLATAEAPAPRYPANAQGQLSAQSVATIAAGLVVDHAAQNRLFGANFGLRFSAGGFEEIIRHAKAGGAMGPIHARVAALGMGTTIMGNDSAPGIDEVAGRLPASVALIGRAAESAAQGQVVNA